MELEQCPFVERSTVGVYTNYVNQSTLAPPTLSRCLDDAIALLHDTRQQSIVKVDQERLDFLKDSGHHQLDHRLWVTDGDDTPPIEEGGVGGREVICFAAVGDV